MMRAGAMIAAVWIAFVAPVEPGESAPASTSDAATCIPAEKCCRVCDRGQACGKTCIARDKACHAGRGCACNASEVCPTS